MAHVRPEPATGLSARSLTVAFLLAALLIFSRCPSLLLHWQFYAEDGKMWFQQAYNLGWLHSLTIPDAGYLNTLQRLLTGPALLIPFRFAPLLQAAEGLLLQAAPVPILLSSRCRTWGSLRARCVMAALYIAVPASTEIHVVLTDSQWHYALMELLLAFAVPPRTAVARLANTALYLLGGFCGPFGLMLIPLLLAFAWLRHQRSSLYAAALLAVGSSVQLWLLTHAVARHTGTLGPNLADLARILGGDIFACALFGQHAFTTGPLALNILAALALFAIFAYALYRAPLPLRLLIVFSALIVAGALHAPMVTGPGTQWHLLTQITGSRYWALPILTLLWSLASLAIDTPAAAVGSSLASRLVRTSAAALLAISLIGIVHDWRVLPMFDEHFAASATRFEQAPVGTHVLIPIYPAGWVMDLVKK